MHRKQPYTVHQGAILVADAHYASYRPEFLTLLTRIDSGELKTTQLILLGDNVDLLVAKIAFYERMEADLIAMINRISQKLEVIYFEGNHDFMLKGLFPNVRIVPLRQQPLYAKFEQHYGWLAHGDWRESRSYHFYTFLQRNGIARMIYRLIDAVTGEKLSKALRQKMKDKRLCRKFDNFEAFINRKFADIALKESWFIEGHYHQGKGFKIGTTSYYNLDAMACNKSYFVVQSKDNELVLERREI